MDDYDIRHSRTYMYFKGEPLYPFGYGLSYTTFQYSKLKLSSAPLHMSGATTVSVNVKNTGTRAGDEVVQLYVRHLPLQKDRPLQELKGFRRITLARGEQRTVSFPVKAESLAWWNENRHGFELETGQVEFRVGSSSADIRGKQSLQIMK